MILTSIESMISLQSLDFIIWEWGFKNKNVTD